MIKVDDKPIKVPHLFIQRLIQEYGETPVLLVMGTSTKIIRIIPTLSKRVIKIIIYINLPGGDILENIDQFFITEKLKTLYTSRCPYDYKVCSRDTCTMDIYLDLDSKDYTLEEFKQKIEQVEGVQYAEIIPIQVSVPSPEKKEEKKWFDSFFDQAKSILRRTQYQKDYLKILEIIYLNDHPTIEIISENLGTRYSFHKIKYFLGYLSKKKLIITDTNTKRYRLFKKIKPIIPEPQIPDISSAPDKFGELDKKIQSAGLEVTRAKMVSLGNKSIELPHFFTQSLIQEYGETPALLVLAPCYTKMTFLFWTIRIIRTRSKRVVKVTIHSNWCVDKDRKLLNLNTFLVSFGITSTYYTTVCMCEYHCTRPIEMYLDLDSTGFSSKQFKQEIEQVEGVQFVEIISIMSEVPVSRPEPQIPDISPVPDEFRELDKKIQSASLEEPEPPKSSLAVMMLKSDDVSDISEMDDDMLSLSLRKALKILRDEDEDEDEALKIRRDDELIYENAIRTKPAKIARKIVLMSLAESGRNTFCKKLLNEKWRPEGEEPYRPIIDYERHQRVLLGTQITFFNLGGQTAFLDRFIGELAKFIFSNTASLVFIVDALNLPEIHRAKYYFGCALDRIQQYSPNALIFLLINKMDRIPLHLKEEVIQSIEDYMLKSVNHDVRVFSTSIFDDSSTQAAEAILRANL